MIANSEASDSLLASHRREVTALFCDLRGFTAFTEASEPEEVMGVLREYQENLGELIFRYEGTLDRFLGDGIMIVFNDPIPCDDHTARAVRLAVDMRERVAQLTMGASGSCARIWHRYRLRVRDPGSSRFRASPRIHRDRQRHKSRLPAVRRGQGRPDRESPGWSDGMNATVVFSPQFRLHDSPSARRLDVGAIGAIADCRKLPAVIQSRGH
jgi:Adenylate and Guanylate cyclase catalytic domain